MEIEIERAVIASDEAIPNWAEQQISP